MPRLLAALVLLALAAGCRHAPPEKPAGPVVEEYPLPSP
jgi:hypothetical protein